MRHGDTIMRYCYWRVAGQHHQNGKQQCGTPACIHRCCLKELLLLPRWIAVEEDDEGFTRALAGSSANGRSAVLFACSFVAVFWRSCSSNCTRSSSISICDFRASKSRSETTRTHTTRWRGYQSPSSRHRIMKGQLGCERTCRRDRSRHFRSCARRRGAGSGCVAAGDAAAAASVAASGGTRRRRDGCSLRIYDRKRVLTQKEGS